MEDITCEVCGSTVPAKGSNIWYKPDGTVFYTCRKKECYIEATRRLSRMRRGKL